MAAKSAQEVIIVKYENCRLDVLPDCGPKGVYAFTPTKRTRIDDYIYQKEDLFERLPMDAEALVPEFDKGGIWSVQAARVGNYQAPLSSVGKNQLSAQCQEATHFVKGMMVGAYRLAINTQKGETATSEVVRTGGVFERCLISQVDAMSRACQHVLKLHLSPLLQASAMPPSKPHHLLDQFPGSERVKRVEAQYFGKAMQVPTAGGVNIVIFWGKSNTKKAGADSSTAVLKETASLWTHLDRQKITIIGAAVGMDIFEAREKLQNTPLPFPIVVDSEGGKLTARYHIGGQTPAIFVIDKNGYVRFFADGSPGDAEKVVAAANALASGD